MEDLSIFQGWSEFEINGERWRVGHLGQHGYDIYNLQGDAYVRVATMQGTSAEAALLNLLDDAANREDECT